MFSRGTAVLAGDQISRGVVRTLQCRSGRYGRAFTFLDLLVSMAVIAVLIGILLPTLASVNETARRVACQSNIRQIGLGVVMYADDWHGQLPASLFLPRTTSTSTGSVPEPQQMVTIRIDSNKAPGNPWDGLGLLYSLGYIPVAKVFYCPSHHGDNPYSLYIPSWDAGGEVVCNYHFRGQGPAARVPSPGAAPTTTLLYNIDPQQSSLIADGLRVRSDYNHRVGVNFFRADLTVHWYRSEEHTSE